MNTTTNNTIITDTTIKTVASHGNAKSFDNKLVRSFLTSQFADIYDYDSYSLFITREVDDILRGASGQGNGNQLQRMSQYRIFMFLTNMDTISVETLRQSPWAMKQELITGKPYSYRYLMNVVNVLLCASKGIEHHLFTR